MKRLAIAILLFATAAHAAQPRVVRLQTPDDVGIVAAYYPAGGSETVPAVLLLHDYGQSRDEWESFATLLQQGGFAALAIDLRGHGESSRRITATGPQLVDYHTFNKQDFQNMLLDINTAADWLLNQPGIDKNKLILTGSGLGANLATRYALERRDIAAMILLSPGLVYQDIRTDDVIEKLRPIPLRMVASVRDNYAFQSATRILDTRRHAGTACDEKELIACSGTLHGTEQLKNVTDLPMVLLRWLRSAILGEIAPRDPLPTKKQPSVTGTPRQPAGDIPTARPLRGTR